MPKKLYGRYTAREHQKTLVTGLSILVFPFFIVSQIFRGRKSELSVSGDNVAKICIVFGFLSIISVFIGGASLVDRLKSAGIGGILIGGGYAWLQYTKKHRENQEISARMSDLDRLFHETLMKKKGQITLFEWATTAQLPREQAKEYLDKKAVEWEALFETSENGTVVYQFPYS